MASNVGPILEMVTEKYLLRGEKEWNARQQTNQIFDNIFWGYKRGRYKKTCCKYCQKLGSSLLRQSSPGHQLILLSKLLQKLRKNLVKTIMVF